jgi:hypothetical protein
MSGDRLAQDPEYVEARRVLRRLFGSPSAHGAAMAVRASVGIEESATIAAACAALAAELLDIWEAGCPDDEVSSGGDERASRRCLVTAVRSTHRDTRR